MSMLSSLVTLLLLVTTCSSVSSNEVLSPDELSREVNRLRRENGELSKEILELSIENRELNKENRELNNGNRAHKKSVNKLTDGFTYLQDNSILAFRLTTGIGDSPYDKYVSVGFNDDHQRVKTAETRGCRTVNGSLPCDRHFRSLFLDVWPSTLIDTVRLSVYEHGKEKAYIVFNGRGSTYTDWFSASRVLYSTWKDLKTEPNNYFSLFGHRRNSGGSHVRTFFINRSYNDCPLDLGWLVVEEDPDLCPWGQKPPYPSILYSRLSTFGNPNNPLQFGQADVLTVTVKLRADVDLSKFYCPDCCL